MRKKGSIQGLFRPIWAHLDPLGPFGPIRRRLGPIWILWAHLGLLSIILSLNLRGRPPIWSVRVQKSNSAKRLAKATGLCQQLPVFFQVPVLCLKKHPPFHRGGTLAIFYVFSTSLYSASKIIQNPQHKAPFHRGELPRFFFMYAALPCTLPKRHPFWSDFGGFWGHFGGLRALGGCRRPWKKRSMPPWQP